MFECCIFCFILRCVMTEYERTVSYILSSGASINFYMFHGGTNFGFMAGANHFKHYKPDVTSYGEDSVVLLQCVAHQCELSLVTICEVTVCCSPVLIIPIDYLFGYSVLPTCVNYTCGLFVYDTVCCPPV